MGGLFGGQTISTSEPRIGALNVQTSAYGMVVPIVYGTNRIPANLVDYADFTAIAHTTTQSSGGKGGGVTTSNTTYTYTVAVAMGLCEGQISGIGSIWANKKQIALADIGATLFDGSASQSPWGYMATNHPGHDLNYRGFAYIAAPSYPLGGSASIPQHSFEVRGLLRYTGQDDANPADIVQDFLTSARHGAGFPAASIGSLTQFSNYCLAAGLLFSPAYTEQAAAQQALSDLALATNTGLVWSEGLLKLVPYGDTAITGALGNFTPNLTPAYDLTDDDFLGDAGSDSVIVTRKAQADAYNQVQVEYLDRANQYNIAIVTAADQANVDLYGLRPLSPLKMHFICDASVARFVAQLVLQRHLYIRNTYEFKLGWKYAPLEPMDLVTLTDAALGLNLTAVRIVAIEENEDGELAITAEEFPSGIAHAALYPSQAGAGYQANYNVAPGNANAPVIFEPPTSLAGDPQIWIATGGGANWGGCEVWVSRDNATYAQVGIINGGARHGVLSANFASGSDPDTTNTLAVDLTVSGGTLAGGTLADRDQMNTLCYVDGELVSFQTATLTAAHRYNLTSLRRGAYGSAIAAHSSGTKFARLDQALFKYAYDPAMIGSTLYIKLRSFNIYGLAHEDLAGLTPITYNVAGSYLGSITGLALAQPFSGRSVKVKWNEYIGASMYKVEVWQSAALKRTVTGIGSTAYEYTFEDMTADGGPWRSVDVKLYAVSANGVSLSAATLNVSNPQVAVPAGLSATAAPLSVTVSATKPADTDYAGMLVYGSTTTGFTPGPGNLLYDGQGNSVTFTGLTAGTPRYYRVAFYDQYGKDGLNLSSEISATPLASGGVPIVSTLPGSGVDGEVVSLTTDHKIYRWNQAVTAWQTWVDGADILASSVTAGKLSVATLAAISADMGSITAGTITLNTSGYIRGGQTAYNTGTGFFLGYSGAAYKFSIGNGTNGLTWDGSVLAINGGGTFSGALSAVTGTFGALTVASGGNIKQGQTAYNTGTGFWIGDASGTPKLSMGNPAGNHLTWDGAKLTINGSVNPYTPGNLVLVNASTPKIVHRLASLEKLKEIAVVRDGTLTIEYTVYYPAASSPTSQIVVAVYKNGSLAGVSRNIIVNLGNGYDYSTGTGFTVNATTPVYWVRTENLVVVAGDAVQIYAYDYSSTDTYFPYIQDFKLKCAQGTSEQIILN